MVDMQGRYSGYAGKICRDDIVDMQERYSAVADLRGLRPLAASNVFLRTYCTSPSNDYIAVACNNNNQAQLHTHISVPY